MTRKRKKAPETGAFTTRVVTLRGTRCDVGGLSGPQGSVCRAYVDNGDFPAFGIDAVARSLLGLNEGVLIHRDAELHGQGFNCLSEAAYLLTQGLLIDVHHCREIGRSNEWNLC